MEQIIMNKEKEICCGLCVKFGDTTNSCVDKFCPCHIPVLEEDNKWNDIKSNEILYSKGKNDECYTPRYAVLPILKYLHKNYKIWCPFDTEESEFVKVFKEEGFNVVYSHINNGQDFLTYEPDDWDIIISNPPFTNKRKYFERALFLDKPFALIMSNTWLNDAAPMKVFKDKDLELLMFTKRINFLDENRNEIGRPTFSSSYFCHNFLPKQIIMEEL